MSKIPKLIKKENEYCENIDCERDSSGQFNYYSENNKSFINLPYILIEYKLWLIEQGYISQIK